MCNRLLRCRQSNFKESDLYNRLETESLSPRVICFAEVLVSLGGTNHYDLGARLLLHVGTSSEVAVRRRCHTTNSERPQTTKYRQLCRDENRHARLNVEDVTTSYSQYVTKTVLGVVLYWLRHRQLKWGKSASVLHLNLIHIFRQMSTLQLYCSSAPCE